jgi:6-phosphofructokinase
MLDKTGKITDVAIGVGGFLGMGERDVAVKFDQLKWSNEPVKSTDSKAGTTTGSAQSQGNRDRNYPDHAVLNATKDQLKAMPQFDYNK